MEETISAKELLDLCTEDREFYARTFFPKTVRQSTPDFHRDMDRVLWTPGNRLVAFKVFRGGAKTSKLRIFASERIAFGISHTILFVGKSQDHAAKSLEWLMRQVEYNTKWARTFGLRKGGKWTSTEIEILHETDAYPIRIIALGITGSVRGVNIDDYRPDLIILDDPCDEENTATPEQRKKTEDLVVGALAKSLAPASESPDAMMVLAQTPLHKDDLIESCMKNNAWVSVQYSCFTGKGESTWPERWSTETLLKEKENHIQNNQLSLWLREMECTVTSPENAAFRQHWLRYYEVLPEQMLVYMGIDPTPPPKDTALPVGNTGKLDQAVIMVIGLAGGNIYVCEYYIAKSPDPEEFVNMFFHLALRWRPMLVGVETTLFQRMLKWYMDKEMQRRGQYFTVIPVEDKRKKETRIIQAITRYASHGKLLLHRSHTDLQEQYEAFQSLGTRQRDDLLDALTIALDLVNPALEGITYEGSFELIEDESSIPALEDWRSAP